MGDPYTVCIYETKSIIVFFLNFDAVKIVRTYTFSTNLRKNQTEAGRGRGRSWQGVLIDGTRAVEQAVEWSQHHG